ncbi:fungal-specific transcription factor domain-containing protein [Exophiala viscosa]|uniref:Fungal-specific transcription factor domain-containing protein n=1 Tax=Exophiala viscosa TaxID=2486360 RepID=A0AAN6IDM9_9EURO|nr:fungal-specific transcription factor domain-containing protein [Exophiala viscosa]
MVADTKTIHWTTARLADRYGGGRDKVSPALLSSNVKVVLIISIPLTFLISKRLGSETHEESLTRKKRCDEGKPECRTCVRLGYVCEGYPKPVRYEARSTTATPAPPARTPAVSQSQRPTIELQGDISWADETIVPYRTNIENQGAPTDTWLGLDDVPTADYFQLDWDALNSSLTEAEMEHMLSTPKSDGLPRAVAVPEEQYQMHKAQPPSSIPQSLPNLIDGLESPIRRQLFTHFTKVTSLVLTTSSGEENPFLTTVVPRSLHDSMIREAILCVAASHLTNLTGKVDLVVTSEKKTTLETAETEQVARLAALKKPVALQKESDREAILISALLLCLYEISEGTGDVCWRIRLDTARSLVQSELLTLVRSTDSRNTSNPSISQFSLEYYMYHDVLARATDPFQQTIFEPSSDTISPSMHTSNSHMIGVYDGLLRMVAKVSALQNKVTEVGRIDGMLICEAMDLWTELERWQPKISSTEDPRQLRLPA